MFSELREKKTAPECGTVAQCDNTRVILVSFAIGRLMQAQWIQPTINRCSLLFLLFLTPRLIFTSLFFAEASNGYSRSQPRLSRRTYGCNYSLFYVSADVKEESMFFSLGAK